MLKKIKSQFNVSANVKIQIIDTDKNEVIEEINRKNLVVDSGLNLIRDLLNEVSDVGVTHLAVGTGTTAAAAGNTTLETEQLRGALTKRTPLTKAVTWSYYLGSSQANGNSLTEAGLLNAAVSGVLFARVTHTAITKTSSIAVMYNWTINLSAT